MLTFTLVLASAESFLMSSAIHMRGCSRVIYPTFCVVFPGRVVREVILPEGEAERRASGPTEIFGDLRLHPSPHLTLHLFDTHAPSICQGPTIFLGIGEQPIHSLSRCHLQARRERAGASVAQWRSAEDSVGGARGKAGLQKENTGMPGRGQARKALPAMLKGKI